MFESRRNKEANITLCMFPHLREFVAIDARKDLPGGAAVRVLSFDSVFTDDFKSSIESAFSRLVRKQDLSLADMIGMPQEVETLIRAESMKHVVRTLNRSAGIETGGMIGGVGILFFTRGLLTIDDGQLHEALRELFGSVLTPGNMDRLQTELRRLIDVEKETEEKSRRSEMSSLIKGEGGSFLTIWENAEED